MPVLDVGSLQRIPLVKCPYMYIGRLLADRGARVLSTAYWLRRVLQLGRLLVRLVEPASNGTNQGTDIPYV